MATDIVPGFDKYIVTQPKIYEVFYKRNKEMCELQILINSSDILGCSNVGDLIVYSKTLQQLEKQQPTPVQTTHPTTQQVTS